MIVFVILYFLMFTDQYKFIEFVKAFFKTKQYITFWGAWCLVGNIALFTFYINTGKDNTAKGIFVLSLIYGIGILLLKLFI